MLDLSGVSEEKAEVLVMVARSSGLRVKPPFRMAGRKPFARAKLFATPARPATPPMTGDMRCANCGGTHSTQECTKESLPFEKQSCLNCGLPGHRAKDCKQPDKRKQSNGRALTVGDVPPKDAFLGVVTAEIPPVPIADFAVRRPGAQARRKQAAKAAKALIGGKAGKCNDSACNITHNTCSMSVYTPVFPVSVDLMHRPYLAQGEIAGSGGGAGARRISSSISRSDKSVATDSGRCPREAHTLALEPAWRTDIYDTYIYIYIYIYM